jgi:hypothetical protein
VLILTTDGRRILRQAMLKELGAVHLYVDAGELSGYGYAPHVLDHAKWDGGEYPAIKFELDEGENNRVMGYFITDTDGTPIASEEFTRGEEPSGFPIGRRGDRIFVTPKLNLLAG